MVKPDRWSVFRRIDDDRVFFRDNEKHTKDDPEKCTSVPNLRDAVDLRMNGRAIAQPNG